MDNLDRETIQSPDLILTIVCFRYTYSTFYVYLQYFLAIPIVCFRYTYSMFQVYLQCVLGIPIVCFSFTYSQCWAAFLKTMEKTTCCRYVFSKRKTKRRVSGSSFWFENEIVDVVLSNRFRKRNKTKRKFQAKVWTILSKKHVHFNLIIISFWLFKDCGAKLITVFCQTINILQKCNYLFTGIFYISSKGSFIAFSVQV